MKRLFLVLSLFTSLSSYSITDSTKTRIKGVTKLAGSFVLGMTAFRLLNRGFKNSRISEQATGISDLFYPTYKRDCGRLAGYQYGTACFWALLTKQLYDSGMNDLTEDKNKK